ncbi:MAG: tRNA (guanosine(37)-N1)-methyltransferase TrmD [bacterium]|nr:tRNA (guanosine(37)-N1)-methyltransferase TrmD [bacterium]MCP5070802.1 tRNA (guanosine(37)-N1)-methyltransferase TrmD [bacterium]
MLHKIDVVTIFPELFETFTSTSILGAALAKSILEVRVHDLRSWTHDRHRKVDDEPYGGGPGMVMKPEPLVEAIEELAGPKGDEREARVVLLSPQGRPFSQRCAEELVETSHLVLVCGRYEGVDQRVIELAVDEEVSIGDYVLSGGEIPAMAVIEAVSRLLPGVLGNPASVVTESFQATTLEGPQFTRPAVFRGQEVPEVLRSGDHAKIDHWRGQRALERTRERRPDLLAGDSETARGE